MGGAGPPAVHCRAVRGGRELWVAMGDTECLWPSWDARWAVSWGETAEGRGSCWCSGRGCLPCPPATVGKVLPIYVPGRSQPHLLPHRPQTLWSQPKDGGGHRAPQRALWVWSGWPSISQLSHQQLSLFISGGFTPTSAELKLSSYSCPVASTEASWQDPARAAPGASHCLSGGWVVQGGQA